MTSKGLDSSIISKARTTTLIIPSISYANLPQLTTDLLLNNLPFKKVSSLDSTFLYPFASPVDYVTKPIEGISTALDLYLSEELGLSLIQQRSPVLPTYQVNFMNQLVKFIKTGEFKRVVLLDSQDYAYLGGFVGVCPTGVYTNSEAHIDALFHQLSLSEETTNKIVKDEDEEINGAFSSSVAKFIQALKKEHVNVVGLVGYVYEGDNFPDSKKLASQTLQVLDVKKEGKEGEWRVPKSWEGVYGDRGIPRSMEEGLFG